MYIYIYTTYCVIMLLLILKEQTLMLQKTICIFKAMLYFDIIVSVAFMPHCGEH